MPGGDGWAGGGAGRCQERGAAIAAERLQPDDFGAAGVGGAECSSPSACFMMHITCAEFFGVQTVRAECDCVVFHGQKENFTGRK